MIVGWVGWSGYPIMSRLIMRRRSSPCEWMAAAYADDPISPCSSPENATKRIKQDVSIAWRTRANSKRADEPEPLSSDPGAGEAESDRSLMRESLRES